MSEKRLAAYKFGIAAEHIAALYLRCKGYRILASRYRNHAGEIDLLAKKGRTFIAVEVKARRTLKDCEETIPPWKRQKIARAMEGALASRGKIAGLDATKDHNVRFDVVWVAPWAWPRHIADAWRI